MGDSLIESYRQLHKTLSVSVKIDHEEVCKVVVNDLIEKRNSHSNKIKDSFDLVLRYYLTEDEFQRFVINGEEVN
jgi:hypothetical protein